MREKLMVPKLKKYNLSINSISIRSLDNKHLYGKVNFLIEKAMHILKINWNLVFNCILRIFQIFGLYPVIDGNKKSTINGALIFLSAMHLAFCGFLVSFACNKFTHDNSGLASFNNMITFAIIVMTQAVILIESVVVRKNFLKIWSQLTKIDNEIRGMIGNYDEILSAFYRHCSLKILTYLLLTFTFELLIILNILSDENWTFMWCMCVVPLSISRLRHLQHTLFIDALTCRFRVIKKELIVMAKFTKLENNRLMAKNRSFYNGIFNKISAIKIVYNLLWETSLLYNRTFGFSQLSNLLQNFIQLTTDLYRMYSFLYKSNFLQIISKHSIAIRT
jgi:7tm Chemosensory receptor